MLGRKRRKPKAVDGSHQGASQKKAEGASQHATGGATPAAKAPERVGRYSIQETLGQGGMGRVYLGHDPVIGRSVAVKVITLRPDMSEEDIRQYHERFLREAQAAGALIHPHIVGVHDIGRDPESGSPFIVMEYVAGRDLKKVIRERAPLSPHEAVRIAAQVAAALDFAHRHGIVHRDIKPANVLIGDTGQVKITDFGVARLPDSDLTQSDQFVGSPGFMSPEQLKGEVADGRSDLFALGVILYQLLTGRSPFAGDSVSEVLYKISTQPPEPPSEIHPDVSADFDPILEKTLAKNPDDRYQSGQDLLAALMEVAERLPDTVMPVEAVGAPQPGAAAVDQAEAPETAEGESDAPDAPDDEEWTTGSYPPSRHLPSTWWNLNSQWRLAGLLVLLLATLIGVNWGILALFRGPFASLNDEAGNSVGRLPKDLGPLALVGATIGGVPCPDKAQPTVPPPRTDTGVEPPPVTPASAPEFTPASAPDVTAAAASLAGGAPSTTTEAPSVAAGGTSICAVSYADPAQIARVLKAKTRLAKNDVAAGPAPTARLRLELKHRLPSGRLVVLLDGKTVLSKPFDTARQKGGAVSHLLSVPAGKHGVEVRLLGRKGSVEAKARIAGTLRVDSMSTLKAEHKTGKHQKLTLAWDEPKTQAAARRGQ